MSKLILAYDLGTGGAKANLYDETGTSLGGVFESYRTFYPVGGWHEQRPEDWWVAIVNSTNRLMEAVPDSPTRIACISLSGQSLGVVPVDKEGCLLREFTPIWSDTRPRDQAEAFFRRIDPEDWYLRTGNGFPPECYTLFKVMWYRDEEPDMYGRISRILGSKDYINLKMTGRVETDHSYASGSGAYHLEERRYEERFFEASELNPDHFPEILPSSEVIGSLLPGPAEDLGLKAGIPVVTGGVDNSCMALGTGNTVDGRVYTSLGSSAWIAVSSEKPVLDPKTRPFVFAHVVPGLYTSAVSIFSAGNSYRWARDVLLGLGEEMPDGRSPYALMDEMASHSPAAANGLLFNPSLAGGSSQEPSPMISGGFQGLQLRHNRNDLIRSVMEGIALNLGSVLTILKDNVELDAEMRMVGGGSRSALWRQIFADVYQMRVVKTNIDSAAGSLGAAALGAVGTGIWKDFSLIDEIHKVEAVSDPDLARMNVYTGLLPVFERFRQAAADLGTMLRQ